MTEEKKFDPFKTEAPSLPGVARAAAPEGVEAGPGILPAGAKVVEEKQPVPMWVWVAAGVGGVLLLLIGFFLLRPAETLEQVHPPGAEVAPAAAAPGSPAAAAPAITLPVAPAADIATVEEMQQPWSSKQFLYERSGGGTELALLVRLPGGAASSSAGYWAFSAKPPFSKCDLEVVTDLSRLRTEYNFRASHPMVVDKCEKVIYDPLSYGRVRGMMLRGDVVQGAGYRPPVAIEIQVTGGRIQATRIEQ